MFWVVYFGFNVLRWGSYFNDYMYSLKSNLIEFPIHVIVAYINIYLLIPKFILKKRYAKYVMLLALMLATSYFIRTGLNYLFVTKDIWPEGINNDGFLSFNHIVAVVLGELYVLGFVTAIYLIIVWSLERRWNEKLAQLQLNTELKYLRTQIQPHFFFNALNNLYALTLKKSDAAPRFVLKISDILQYILYEVSDKNAELIEEINYIHNFIDIERMRFAGRVDCEVDIIGSIEDVFVPPLLFLNFIENSFKHGLKSTETVKIKMSFEVVEKGYLEFKISNTFSGDVNKDIYNGIGIPNTQRRLNLLFPNNYILKTTENDGVYELYLKIPV